MVFPPCPIATNKLVPLDAKAHPAPEKILVPRPVHEIPFELVAILFPVAPTAIHKLLK